MKKKIFVVGPNKCGSISLHTFFKKNGYQSVHWKNGTLALKILSNISSNLNPLNGLEKYDCFLDMFFITDGLYISPLALRDRIINPIKLEQSPVVVHRDFLVLSSDLII